MSHGCLRREEVDMWLRVSILVAALALAFGLSGQEAEQGSPSPLDDPLLARLEGQWVMDGTLMGESVRYDLRANWVLKGQFLLLEMRDVAVPSEYEARIYIGWSAEKSRYVVHWLDPFGGEPSATLGFGSRDGNSIRLLFDYPSTPFRDVLTFDESKGVWRFLIESRDSGGEWAVFADYVATPVEERSFR
jgi:hypothetical protein